MQAAKAAGTAEEGPAEEENGTEVASSFTANVWEVLCKPGAPQHLLKNLIPELNAEVQHQTLISTDKIFDSPYISYNHIYIHMLAQQLKAAHPCCRR